MPIPLHSTLHTRSIQTDHYVIKWRKSKISKITSISKLNADREVKLAILSLYVFPGTTVKEYGEQSEFVALQTPEAVSAAEQLNLPLPFIKSD